MKFEHTTWSLRKLIDFYNAEKLNLAPPYQRNFIWPKRNQNELIDSILVRNYPLPSFFVFKKSDGCFDVVDGQQRSRAIISFYKSSYSEDIIKGHVLFDEKVKFENYLIPITIITEINKSENIEEFYARVNRTGLKLNKPELNKAEYYNTLFLKLNEELAGYNSFVNLDLFTETASRRMNDIDFTSELVASLHNGITDKKLEVDSIYENDISKQKFTELKNYFCRTIDKFALLNKIYPINKTRYKQKNDFYTFFNFISKNEDLNSESLLIFYKIAILIGPDISPSNEFCEPLKEYARNCVTQSNSKKARENRLLFLEKIFLNKQSKPNDIQQKLIDYYELSSELIRTENNYTLNFEHLLLKKPSITFI
jgi:hypothetical protein